MRRSIRRSAPELGSSPASRAVIAASQSMLASSVPGSLMLFPAWMKQAKSSQASHDSRAMISPVAASIAWRPPGPARSAAGSGEAVRGETVGRPQRH